MQEPKTAPSPPPQEQPFSPAPAELVEQQPPPEPRPEEVAPSGEETVVEEVPSPWGSIREPKDVLEHEDIRPLVEERLEAGKTEAYDKAYSDVQARLQPLALKRNEHVESISGSAEQILTVLRRAQQDGTLDQRAVEDIFTQHRSALDALRGVHQGIGVGAAISQIAQTLGLVISPAVQMAYGDWSAGKSTSMDFLNDFAADVKAKAAKEEVREAEEKGRQKGLKEAQGAQAELAATRQRGKEGANLTPGSPAGGKSDDELLLDPNTPIETIKEIQARQAAGR